MTSNGSTLTLTPATFEVIAQESNKTVAQIAQEFNAFQQVLSTYDLIKNIAPNTPPPTDGQRGDANPQQPTKFAGTQPVPTDSPRPFSMRRSAATPAVPAEPDASRSR